MSRILFINNTSELGAGTSRSLLLLVKQFRSIHQMAVVLHEGEGQLPAELEKEGVPCFILPRRARRFLPCLVWRIIRGKYDLVYANNFCGHAECAAWAAKLSRRPFIWHIRESLTEKSPKSLTWSIRLASAIIANSHDTAERVKRFASRLPDGLFTIYNGVDIAAYDVDRRYARHELRRALGISEDSLVILNVGRVCHQKNQLDTLEAAAQVLLKQPRVYLAFVGPIEEEDYVAALREHPAGRAIRDRVFFTGLQANVAPHLVGADILIHTSRKESHGRVILEAMAAALPVVAYEVGGIRESLVHGQTGFLVDWADISGLAASLEQLVSHPELRREFGGNGQRMVAAKFTAQRAADQVRDVIDVVLAAKTGRAFVRSGNARASVGLE